VAEINRKDVKSLNKILTKTKDRIPGAHIFAVGINDSKDQGKQFLIAIFILFLDEKEM